MKLFEIGDGLKSIKVTSDYYSDWENDNKTVVLYKGEDNEPTIRISVITVEPKDAADINNAYNSVIKKGEEKGYPITKIEDKSYHSCSEEIPSENSTIIFYEIGYKCNFVIISVTVSVEDKDSPRLQAALRDIESFIPSIAEVSLKEVNIFEPKYTDFANINQRVASVLEIKENDIDNCHETGTTLSKIQQILDEKRYAPEQTYELQSLGLALGDYIQYKDDNLLHWAVVQDEYGRDICLQYKRTAMTVFPMTMLSKRVEDGEEVVVEALVKGLFNLLENHSKENELKELDHNY